MGADGSLVYYPDQYTPSADGPIVYFTAWSGDVTVELSWVEAAGEKVLMEKREISPEHGYMALLLDSEGNRISLHSRN